MTASEFSPHEYFSRILSFWWVVLLATILGAGFGFLFFELHPPLYEATATYFVTLDMNRFPTLGVRADLIQYNEDMALNTTEGALLSTEVLNQVVSQAKDQGIVLTVKDLLDNYTIERKMDLWELRYRNQVPAQAQAITNIWAQLGYNAMLSWQASGKAPEYVIFQPPSQVLTPQQPVVYGRNTLVLAGALIGFVVGIVISIFISRPAKQRLANDK
jgi:capsular polysaccharide biosynthesis protein